MNKDVRVCDILIRMIQRIVKPTATGAMIYPIKIRLDKETFDKLYHEGSEATCEWRNEKFHLTIFQDIPVEEVETHNFLIELVMP